MGQQAIGQAHGQGEKIIQRGGQASAERRQANERAANEQSAAVNERAGQGQQQTRGRANANSRDGEHEVRPVESSRRNPMG